MLAATLRGDKSVMAGILEPAHNTESPIFSYNSGIERSAVVNLVYLAARDKYCVVDFIFYPERKNGDALILELKVDSTPEEAIMQNRDKNYALRFKRKMGGETKVYRKDFICGNQLQYKDKGAFLQGGSIVKLRDRFEVVCFVHRGIRQK